MSQEMRVRWSPIKWTPNRLGGPAREWDGSILKVPLEAAIGAGAGFMGGLVAGKPVGELLRVSEPMATGFMAAALVATPLVFRKNIQIGTRNFLYGLGIGLGAASVFRVIQSLFWPPAA